MSLRAGSPGGSLDRADALVNALEKRVRECVGSEDFDAWFAGTPCRYDPSGSFIFTAQSPFRTKWIETKYGELLRGIARELCEKDVSLSFESATENTPEQAAAAGPATVKKTGFDA